MIFQLFLVILIFVFGYFGFGLFLLKKLNLKVSLSEKLMLGLLLSISLITSLIAVLGQFFSVNAYYFLIPVFLIGSLQYKEIFSVFKSLLILIKNNILGVIFYLLMIAILSSTIIFGYFTTTGSLILQEVHDSIWHIALIQNLKETIPPLHPSTDTVILNNYHYFYDLFLSGVSKFSNIPDFILYFQVSIIFLSTTLLGTAFILGKSIKNNFSGYLLMGATTFIGSISYLIPVLFHPEQPWHESSFWVSQTLVMMVNPQVIYTLSITYLVILIIKKLELINKITSTNKKEYFGLHLSIIILTATSIGFKSYAWVILSVIYAVVLLRELFKHKSFLPIGMGIIYSVFSLPFLWLITRFQGNSFFYEPLWFTNVMIEGADRVNYLEWKFLQDHYVFKKDWLRLWFLETKKIAVFYFGNLGIRSLFLGLPILALFKKHRNKINWSLSFYIFVGFLFSSIFPLLFLQRGTVWNSIQFWYYSLIFANILLVMFLSEILYKKNKILIGLVLVVLLIAAVPTGIKTIQDKTKSPQVFNSEVIVALGQIDESETILLCPEGSQLYHSALVKVLSPGRVYLANPSQLTLVGSDVLIAEEYEKIIVSNNSPELKKIIDNENVTTIICKDNHFTIKFKEMLKTLEKETKVEVIGNWNFIKI